MKNSNNYSSKKLIDHAKELFPICRSITGKGIRKTLDYFESFHSEFKRIKIPSGDMVFDWEVPYEWNIRNSFIEHIESGKNLLYLRIQI